MKVALIGCGRIGKRHAEILAKYTRNARLAAVADIVPRRAMELGCKYKVPYFETDCNVGMPEIVAAIKPDLITLATPSGVHYDNIRQLLKFGKPLLVEKPAVLRLDQIDQFDHQWVGEIKQNRYNVAVQHLSDNLHRLGKIHMVSIKVLWSRDSKYYQDWHGSWCHAGGVLANQAIHHIDLLWWLLGDVTRVSAFATYSPYTDVETGLVATLEFESGTIGTVEATTLTRPRDLEGSLTLIGEEGTVRLGGFAVNTVELWQFTNPLPRDEAIIVSGENPPNIYGYGHIKLYDDIDLDKGPPIPLWQAGKSLEIVHAIYESIETGQVVKLNGEYTYSRLGHC